MIFLAFFFSFVFLTSESVQGAQPPCGKVSKKLKTNHILVLIHLRNTQITTRNKLECVITTFFFNLFFVVVLKLGQLAHKPERNQQIIKIKNKKLTPWKPRCPKR